MPYMAFRYGMLKRLKAEVEAKEWSMFTSAPSELEKENKDWKYITSSFLNNAQGKWCPFCKLSNYVASKFIKPVAPNAPFLYPLKTSENLTVLWNSKQIQTKLRKKN